MKILFVVLGMWLVGMEATAQRVTWINEKLNTAAHAVYMLPQEREMMYELNRLRSDPPRYAQLFIKKQLADAQVLLQTSGKGGTNYSVATSYRDNRPYKTDTIFHYVNEENYHALQTLYDTLMQMRPLPILFPDKGIYQACRKHAADQVATKSLSHQGTDGSWPWERIKAANPSMRDGNENLACGPPVARAIVLQLLVDAGISDYGHRYNMLQPQWTHAACFMVKERIGGCTWWIQNFGARKK